MSLQLAGLDFDRFLLPLFSRNHGAQATHSFTKCSTSCYSTCSSAALLDVVAIPVSDDSLTALEPRRADLASFRYSNWRYSKQGLAKIRKDLNEQAVERVRGMVEQERVRSLLDTHKKAAAFMASYSRAFQLIILLTTGPAAFGTRGFYLDAQRQRLGAPFPTNYSTLTLRDPIPHSGGRTVACHLLPHSNLTPLRRLQVQRNGSGDSDDLPQEVLPSQYLHGLPPQECHVGFSLSARAEERLLIALGFGCRLTCVFLATKTENHPTSIDSFSSKTRTTPDDILSLEFLVSQSLRFEYKVHHAHLAASGLLLDMQVRVSQFSGFPLPC